ncbi:orotate phosphoribosyltransferase, partial [Ascosphaera pollenicola]
MSRQPGGYAYPSDAPAVAPAAAGSGGAKGATGAAVNTAGVMDGRTRRPQGYEYTYTSEQHFNYTTVALPPPPPSTTIDPALQPTPSSSNVGARRKKMFGYLKAANELRQNYSAQLMQKIGADAGSNDTGARECPSNFTDPLFSAQGDEQMVLFPTYAKRHRKRRPRDSPSLQRYVDQASDRNDQQAQMELARWRA